MSLIDGRRLVVVIVKLRNNRAHILTDFALVAADKCAAVVLNDGCQVGGSEAAIGHPARELVVPDAVVSTEELAVSLRQVSDLITAREGERAASRFRSVLHKRSES